MIELSSRQISLEQLCPPAHLIVFAFFLHSAIEDVGHSKHSGPKKLG
jgi:hypothetical protein